jgi:DNA-directed RNA polymerase specialized sigma subunit
MVALNARYPIKNYYVVKPTHHGWFAKYEGVFEEQYRINKEEKMKTIRKELYEELNTNKTTSERNKIVKNMSDKGLTQKEISNLIGLSPTTVSRTLKEVTTTANNHQVYINGGQGEKNENKN